MTSQSSTGTEAKSTGRESTITAFFEKRKDAEEAVQALRHEGFSDDRIRLVPGAERDASPERAPPAESRGFFQSLADLFLPHEDRYSYAEGLSRGGTLVCVKTNDESYETALDILDREGTIDMDERESEWRLAGWAGYRAADVHAVPKSALATGSLAGSTGVGADFVDETDGAAPTLAAASRERLGREFCDRRERYRRGSRGGLFGC